MGGDERTATELRRVYLLRRHCLECGRETDHERSFDRRPWRSLRTVRVTDTCLTCLVEWVGHVYPADLARSIWATAYVPGSA